MPDKVRRPGRLRRAAAIATAALGLGVGALAVPAVAGAGVCSVGEFCMWSNVDTRGGLYHNARSDSDLWNDRFENTETNVIVANDTRSWWNRGTIAGGPPHVRLFTGRFGGGYYTCAPSGSSGNFGYDSVNRLHWGDNVESFAWRSSC